MPWGRSTCVSVHGRIVEVRLGKLLCSPGRPGKLGLYVVPTLDTSTEKKLYLLLCFCLCAAASLFSTTFLLYSVQDGRVPSLRRTSS